MSVQQCSLSRETRFFKLAMNNQPDQNYVEQIGLLAMEGGYPVYPLVSINCTSSSSATCNMCLERSLLRATILIDSKQPVQPNINLAAWIDARMDARFDAFEKRMDVRFQAIEDKLDKFIAEMRLR